MAFCIATGSHDAQKRNKKAAMAWSDEFFRRRFDCHPTDETPEAVQKWADIYIGRNDVGKKAVKIILK